MFNLKLSTIIIFIVAICCINVVNSALLQHIKHLREVLDEFEELIRKEEFLVQTLNSNKIKNCFSLDEITAKLAENERILEQDKLLSTQLENKIELIENRLGIPSMRHMENHMSRRFRPLGVAGEVYEQMSYIYNNLNSLNPGDRHWLTALKSHSGDGNQFKNNYLDMMRINDYNKAKEPFERFERNCQQLSRSYNTMVREILTRLDSIN